MDTVDVLLYVAPGITDEELTFDEKFIPELLESRIRELPSFRKVFVLTPQRYSGKLEEHPGRIEMKGKDDVPFWKDLLHTSDARHFVRIEADSPFFDVSLMKEMLEIHTKYLAEFTYSENLPPGFACEIYWNELITGLPELEENTLPLGEVIRHNINHFDVEMYYHSPDIRDRRISFLSRNSRDRRIMGNIMKTAGNNPGYDRIAEVLESDPSVMYVSPSYLEIELTGACDLDCIFCYRKTFEKARGEMDASVIDRILEEMGTFRLPYTIAFGGSGEPLQHSRFYSLAEKVLDDPMVERLVIETNGTGADANFHTLFRHGKASKLQVIVNISGVDRDTYLSLHGADCFDRVVANIEALKAIDSPAELYVQLLKINETEPFTDRYYDLWEEKGVSIVFQKQNTYLGNVEDRRYSDLSPLERKPCWHLLRDLAITSDGRVPYCRQDIRAEHGNHEIGKTDIIDIWKERKDRYLSHTREDYPAFPDCKSCDEWYTFNY